MAAVQSGLATVILGGAWNLIKVPEFAAANPSWKTVIGYTTPLDQGRVSPGAGVLADGTRLVFGGIGLEGETLSSAYDFYGNPSAPASMSTPRSAFGYATDENHHVYAIGGAGGDGGGLSSAEYFDQSSNTWTTIAPLPEGLSSLSAVADGAGHVFAFGGINNGNISSAVFRYTIATNVWDTVASLPVATDNSAAVLGSNGLIYVLGGVTSTGTTANVESYNETTNTWTTETALPAPVSAEAATSDSLGRIVVAGGFDASGIATASTYFSQQLNQPDAAPVITSAAPGAATANQAYTFQVLSTGNPQPTYSLTTAPAGMTIDSNTGLISWTPTPSEVGYQAVTVQASNYAGQTPQTYSVAVIGVPPTGVTATGNSTSSIALSWNASTDPGGVSGYNVYEAIFHAVRGHPGYYTYPVVVTGLTTTSYTVTGLAAGSFHTYVVTDVGAVTGLETAHSAMATGEAWIAPTLPTYVLWGGYYYYWPVPVTQGQTVQVTIAGGGNPAPTYSITSGPSTMSIDPNSGVVTYTPGPSEIGQVNYTVQAANAAGSATYTYSFQVSAVPTVVVSGGPFVYDTKPHAASATAYGLDGVTPVSGSFTFTYNGSATTPSAIGTYAVVASFTSNDPNYTNATGTGSVTINPGPASSFVVSGFTSPITAGVAGSFTVTAKDAYGNTATGYTGTVHFTSTDSQAALPASYTFTTADAGVHIFSATLKTAGTQSLTATDAAQLSITGTQSSITVNAAAASALRVTGFASPAAAGVANSFTVTALDPYGNTVAGYRGTVKFSSSDKQASLPASYTFASTDNGVHTFSATLKTAGSQSLTATDTKTAPITGTQTGITVNPAAAKTLTVAGFPSPTTAGIAHSFTVTAKDAFGNIATGYGGTVHFTSSDSQAVLPSDYTFLGSDAGVHSFSATLKTAGSRSVTAKDTVTATITGAQSGITVNATAASKLMLSAASSVTAGTAFTLTVTAQDPYGNTAPSYTGTVHFTSSDSQVTLPSNYTFTSSDAGKHTFTGGVTLKTAGKQTMTATDTVTASITGSATVNVTAAAASTLSLSAPATITAGTAFTLTVTALDPYGNRATGYRGTVHFTSSDPKAVLPADYPFTTSDNGVHSFSRGATLKTAGTQSITATDTVTSTITGQASIKVSAAAASILVVSGFPSPIAHGTAASFTVMAEDAYGNIATGYLGTIHFTSSDTAASLPANYTFTATDAGVHTFSATLNTAGTQTITATDKLNLSITGAESGIQVTAAAVERLFGSELLDTEEAGGMINPFDEGRPAALTVVLAALPDDLLKNAGTRSRLTEALFSSPPYPGEPMQEASVSAGGLAVLAGAYGFVAGEKSQRRRKRIGIQ